MVTVGRMEHPASPCTIHSLAMLDPGDRAIACDITFWISLGSRSDDDLGRRQDRALRRRMVAVEIARRAALTE